MSSNSESVRQGIMFKMFNKINEEIEYQSIRKVY